MSYNNQGYEFIHESRFDRELGDILGNTPRADEFLRGVQKQLCADPFSGHPIDRKGKVFALFSNIPGYTGIGIYYAVNLRAGQIVLLSIYDSNGEDE